jgi:adenine-specific DNA methylase
MNGRARAQGLEAMDENFSMNSDRRLIEASFPVKEVSRESVKEKNIRHGHISTMHIWWARRPLAASRATAYAALVPAPKDEKELKGKMKFIHELSKWENSLDLSLIEKARKEILDANGGRVPRVLDPFAGGGSIPLEALRLGCEAHAGEYNPVAVLILKCTLEYPQKYGASKNVSVGSLEVQTKNRLLEDVKNWGEWVLEEARKEIGRFYPQDEDGSIPVGYIWARTIPCQNPSCGAEIPLMRQFWLAKKEKRKIALKPHVREGRVEFEIVGQDKAFPKGFDPSKGTVRGAVATCLICGSTVDDDKVRKLFQEGKSGQRMIAVVLHHPKKTGKFYRIANEKDLDVFRKAEEHLKEKRRELMSEWGTDPVPDEQTPEGKGKGAERAFSVRNYGLNTWGDLFNSRQKLALIAFAEKVRLVHEKMIEKGYDEEYAKAVASYLGLGVDMTASFSNTLARWENTSEAIKQLYSRQALPMLWDYAEVNSFSGSSGSWEAGWEYYLKVLEHCSQISSTPNPESLIPKITHSSATSLPYPDNYFDAVFTDPPYYDNVPYSYLSDFFYVWLKRTVGDLYPDLFSTPLTPKSREIVAYTHDKSWEEAKEFFESNLKKSFQEIQRVLKPGGVATIVYTHKSTEGWETLINSLLDSGLVVTASWPIHTEMAERLRAQESAALASSIYFVARKIKREEIGWYPQVKEEIRKYTRQKLEKLWQEGISGADFFISAIGSAVEIFGKYEKVMDYEGNVIRADKLIDLVRDVVVDYAIRQILRNGIVEQLSPLTKFYILYRWTYQDKKVHFDDARKLAQSAGIDLSQEWDHGFIKKEKEFIKVLGPDERNLEDMGDSEELIDVLHKVLIMWKNGKREDMKKVLSETGWGGKELFYRVAQAIAGMLDTKSDERRWLEGFLSEKERLITEMRKMPKQMRLFE